MWICGTPWKTWIHKPFNGEQQTRNTLLVLRITALIKPLPATIFTLRLSKLTPERPFSDDDKGKFHAFCRVFLSFRDSSSKMQKIQPYV